MVSRQVTLVTLTLALAACDRAGPDGGPSVRDASEAPAARATDAARARDPAARASSPADAAASATLDATAAAAPEPDAGPPARRVSIVAAGDLVIHPRVIGRATGHRSPGRL